MMPLFLAALTPSLLSSNNVTKGYFSLINSNVPSDDPLSTTIISVALKV